MKISTGFKNQRSIAIISMQIAFMVLFIGPVLGAFSFLFSKALFDDNAFGIVLNIMVVSIILVFLLIKSAKKSVLQIYQVDVARAHFFIFQLTVGILILYFIFMGADSLSDAIKRSINDSTIIGIQFVFDSMLMVANSSYIVLVRAVGEKLSFLLLMGFLFDFVIISLPVFLYIRDSF